MSLDVIQKILIEVKQRKDLAELLKYSYENIEQSDSWGTKLYSRISTFEIYSPLKQHSELKELPDRDITIILDAVQIAIPAKDYGAEVTCIEFFLDDNIDISKIETLETQEISEITKRNIIDEINLSKINIYGRLSELEFLKRIYNLTELPSHDHRYANAEGDIIQHTVNNYDWGEDWVLNDNRLEILSGSDQTFLRFICEILHPAVQPDDNNIEILHDFINKHLILDGWELYIEKYISNKPIYNARKIKNDIISTKIKFKVVDKETDINEKFTDVVVLVRDQWDDFYYKTTFSLFYVKTCEKKFKIGNIKIIKKNMPHGFVEIPQEFEKLDDEYCSVGSDQNYYEEIIGLYENISNNILISLRDCVFNQNIYYDFLNEEPMKKSLLRKNTSLNITETFKNILNKNAKLTSYKFDFELKNNNVNLSISVQPDSLPPTNVHVLIGRNGVGKTRLLAGIAESILENENKSYKSLKGQIEFLEDNIDAGRFSGLITIVFSTFDGFTPLSKKELKKKNITYEYVGLKTIKNNNTKSDFKNIEDLNKEFKDSLANVLNSIKKERWINAIKILNNDPCFNELDLPNLSINNEINKICEQYKILSSGHKIVLLSITKLVDLVNDRTLVLLDEPENHLHPPLLSSYIRALSELLKQRNGVSIIATHSPVVLQEVPRSCVSIINRFGDEYTINRPTIETFGENVGILTREVFKLEVESSGFHEMLSKEAKEKNYEQIIELFNKQIGFEGKALLRSILLTKGEENA